MQGFCKANADLGGTCIHYSVLDGYWNFLNCNIVLHSISHMYSLRNKSIRHGFHGLH